jgi:hypothetical protein
MITEAAGTGLYRYQQSAGKAELPRRPGSFTATGFSFRRAERSTSGAVQSAMFGG